MSLRVLIIAHEHPELKAGGAQIAAHLLFRGLRQVHGVEPFFLAWSRHPGPTGSPFWNFDGHPGEVLFFAPDFDGFLLSQLSPGVIEGFASLLERTDPDVIHFHHYVNIGFEFIAVARHLKPQTRIIVTLHEFKAICHHSIMVKTGNFALCERASDADCAACFPDIHVADFARRQDYIRSHFGRVDSFIAPSEFLRQRYIGWGIPAWQIVVIENGIEPVRPPPPRPLGKGERRAIFSFFGQIHPFKGLIELLSAFNYLGELPPEMSKDMRLIIHGANLELNGPDYITAFTRLVEQNGSRVHFAGPYDRRDQYRLMAAVDWVVVPSIWWENSPLVIQEALAHRRPIICSDIGGMREKVRCGKDGFHFPVGNTAELAALLVRLAADDAVWDGLQSAIRQPTTVAESVFGHLKLYRSICPALQIDGQTAPAGTGVS